MLYRPNYCCNCGEKVARAEWRLLTSRRFCELCETEFKGTDYVPRAIVAVGLVLSIFGFRGMFWPSEIPPAVSATSAPKTTLKSISPPKREQQAATENSAQTVAAVPESGPAVAKTIEQTPSPAKTSEQPTYFCGTLTKKGTPCSRRVKIKGSKCWQHNL
jgi:hypothetical protein